MLTIKRSKRSGRLVGRKFVTPDAIPKQVKRKLPGLFRTFGKQMVDSTHTNFRQQISPDGKKWRKLKSRTAGRKGHGNILIDSGTLMGSISVLRQSSGEVAVGPATPYGQEIGHYHQVSGIPIKIKGGKSWRIKRPFLGFSKPRNDLEAYRKQLLEALKWR